MVKPYKPTKDDLLKANGKTLSDVIGRELKVLFCGINPGLYSAAVGHHFARPGNRFWPALFAAGFTDRLLSPFEERGLLKSGYGITNIVSRATASAAELSGKEIAEGGNKLKARVWRYRPRCVAVLGISAYRIAFEQREAGLGQQREPLGETIVWVLPNPSGLNVQYKPSDLARLFRELRLGVDRQE